MRVTLTFHGVLFFFNQSETAGADRQRSYAALGTSEDGEKCIVLVWESQHNAQAN